ncbi:MAG TPA: tRNA (N6-isopentenyl adenosine(37)-C2)-methylthiotransferase MiaB [Kofleriaceae bacterium]|jgi:tRNA-2-methylthio-N6-dimethylallyladenosine synthase
MSERLVPLGKRSAHVAPRAEPRADAPRVFVETYGCQMNVADSDLIGSVLAGAGYATAERADDADVIVVNTCAVREKAEDRVLARAAELGALKRRRPGVVLAIVGCMAEHLKEGLADRAPAVDVIAGPDSYRRMPELLAAARTEARGHQHPLVDVKLDKAETYDGLSGAVGGDGVSGFVTIQRGCDKFCTFCVVPFTRGRERGAPPREVLRQVRELADAGYREVTLLGQTVNSYRYDGASFAELLRAVAGVDGIERIRFTSPYPVDFTADVIAAIADEPKVSKYVHLPVQSGSDVVLERMRRGYTVGEYKAIVGALRAAVPHIALSTDILTGFSGETDDDHALTLELMREVRFDSAFMFAYSERDLTFAAKKLPDDVPPAVKSRRLAEIVALQETISGEVFAAHVGRHERVLVTGPSRRDPNQLVGRTDGFKSVILPTGVGAVGELVDVEIARATMATLFAR